MVESEAAKTTREALESIAATNPSKVVAAKLQISAVINFEPALPVLEASVTLARALAALPLSALPEQPLGGILRTATGLNHAVSKIVNFQIDAGAVGQNVKNAIQKLTDSFRELYDACIPHLGFLILHQLRTVRGVVVQPVLHPRPQGPDLLLQALPESRDGRAFPRQEAEEHNSW